MRLRALKQQQPTAFAQSIGTIDWERVCRLLDMGRYEWAAHVIQQHLSKAQKENATNSGGICDDNNAEERSPVHAHHQ